MTTSAAFELADQAVDLIAADDPCLGLILGLGSTTPTLTDFSPAGHIARFDHLRDLADRAARTPVESDADRIALQVMGQQFGHTLAAADAGDYLRTINVLASPPQQVRMTLEFATDDHIATQLLTQVGPALAGWRETLHEGVRQGCPAARRQAVAVAEQMATYAQAWLPAYVAGRDIPDDAVERAHAGFTDTAVWLSDVYAAMADPEDAVGEERYVRAAAAFNGVDLDLDDTYDWGWHEIGRLSAELRHEADRILPEVPLRDLRAALSDDPTYQIHGVPALTDHLQRLTEQATDRVDQVLFDIDPRVRECHVRIAAEGSAAAPYYVQPSEDLSRPGTTWYPTRGAEVFPRWWLESVWYHEAVPGHHLQLGATAVQESMSRFQRLLGFTSGHAEGWALYAERLADELGWFDEPGTRIGFLSAQLMRAVRVVVDIGLHTGRTVPAGFPGQRGHVTPKMARQLLMDVALLDADFAASEVDRYLGMPRQAISYKVGERVWWELRSDAKERLGPQFDLKDWHMAAIRLGPMGLAQFRDEMSHYGR